MAQAQEWNGNPKIFQVNRLPAHATLMPYNTIEEALAFKPKTSSHYFGLSGDWKFMFVKTPAERSSTFFQDNFDVSSWKSISVPGSWQTQGYDYPIYTNTTFPWTGRDKQSPPGAPTSFNPVGHYRRTFTLPAQWSGQQIRLHTEGIESCFYVWVNGKYVGYSEDSFSDHEFDLTDKLRPGENNISVQVFRWCDGSWMEDQDMIRLSGIFRDIYLFSTPSTHIQDFQIDAGLATNYTDGNLKATVTVKNFKSTAIIGYSVDLHLYDKLGTEVFTAFSQPVASLDGGGTETKATFQNTVNGPALWSAETPNLYTLVLALKDNTGAVIETESARVGFRKVELKKDASGLTRFYVNNQPVMLKGTNRHEMDPDHGRTLSLERITQDITIMKQHNINALRMSHYPNDPRTYDLCDQYGIYLIDEANLESHGVNGTLPRSSDDWRAASVDRMTSMVQRDKNHPSILLWSLGNEAGSGNVFTSMRDYAHAADPTRPVHYEGDAANSDVHSLMYPSPSDVQKYSTNSKPLILCEYDHAMGNSEGNLKEYVDAFYGNPRSFGGFIWDFVDQGLRRGTTQYFNYGGLWGDNPNDDNFCANGLVFPDRKVQPEIQEVKYQYRNVVVKGTDLVNGKVSIENRNYFVNLGYHVGAKWELKENGNVLQSGTIPASDLDVAPRAVKTVTIPFTAPQINPGSEYWLSLDFGLKASTPWADAGFSVAHEQLQIPFTVPLPPTIALASLPKFTMTQADSMVNFAGTNFAIAFNKNRGIITNYTYAGTQILKSGPVPNFWRAPNDNDIGNGMGSRCAKWKNAGRDRILTKCTVTSVSASETKIAVHYNLSSAGSSGMDMTYTFYGSGDVIVEYTLSPDASMSEIPNVGTLLTLPEGFETLTWYGRGWEENYCDRKVGYPVGLYSGEVDSMTIPYLEISETGQRTDVRWATLTNSSGVGLLAVGSPLMEINAQHHTPQQLDDVKYPWDLTRQADVSFRIDLRQMGVGGINSWGTWPLDAYLNYPKSTYKHTFRLVPIDKQRDAATFARQGFKNISTSSIQVEYNTTSIRGSKSSGKIFVPGIGDFALRNIEHLDRIEIMDVKGRRVLDLPVVGGLVIGSVNVRNGIYLLNFRGEGMNESRVVNILARHR